MSDAESGIRLFGKTVPLYVQILVALILAIVVGVLFGGWKP
ncbi:hypothetical protein [Phormidesmis priestleyi]|nr:hypothetical protein [Phormidesmis priestleyi]